MLVWDIGVGTLVTSVTHEDRLLGTFAIWETQPASEHLFLVWLTPDHFEQGVAYTNHLHPFLFFLYACTVVPQVLLDVPAYAGRNLIPFGLSAAGIAAVSTLVLRTVPLRGAGTRFYAVLFLALGVFTTQGFFWIYLYTWNFDSVFPLIVFFAALVWALGRQAPDGRYAGAVTAAALFGAFGWVYTPLLIVALWSCAARPAAGLAALLRRNPTLVRASAACAATGALSLGLPLVLVALSGYTTASSTFLFRSGLDGDARYFTNMVQAVLWPLPQDARHWSALLPAFVPMAAALAIGWPRTRAMRSRRGREALFFFAPYVFSVALFPQSVSIHPYLYDHLLLLPAALLGVIWSLRPPVQRRLHGPWLLAALLLALGLIMSNFIAIAQTVRVVATAAGQP
jgi:hypothetical protein